MACNEQTKDISELSDENCNKKESNDAPSTSAELRLPNETAHNMNDLKLFDYNSADDVRQTMVAVLAGKGSNFDENAVDFIAVNAGDEELQRKKLHLHLMSKITGTDELKSDDKDMLKTIKPTTLRLLNNNNTSTSRKRPGRPPKAGPSKKIKKPRVGTFYCGKLSNVVFLKRKRGSNGKDIGSLRFY